MTNQKQRPQAVDGPLFSRKIVTLERPIPVACVVGAKGGGGEEENRFLPFSLLPYHLPLSMPVTDGTY